MQVVGLVREIRLNALNGFDGLALQGLAVDEVDDCLGLELLDFFCLSALPRFLVARAPRLLVPVSASRFVVVELFCGKAPSASLTPMRVGILVLAILLLLLWPFPVFPVLQRFLLLRAVQFPLPGPLEGHIIALFLPELLEIAKMLEVG